MICNAKGILFLIAIEDNQTNYYPDHRVKGVIDDPVSSLDGNALFISSLVRKMVEVCYNNTDYRCRTVRGSYIKQLFILTHNAQFHRSITYNQVVRYSCVNFYKINKYNNNTTVKLCVRPSQAEAGGRENYNTVKNAYAAL